MRGEVDPVVVDKKTAAHMLAISIFKLDQLMHNGDIAAKLIGSRVVFEVDEIRRYVKECPSWQPSNGRSAS